MSAPLWKTQQLFYLVQVSSLTSNNSPLIWAFSTSEQCHKQMDIIDCGYVDQSLSPMECKTIFIITAFKVILCKWALAFWAKWEFKELMENEVSNFLKTGLLHVCREYILQQWEGKFKFFPFQVKKPSENAKFMFRYWSFENCNWKATWDTLF